MFEKFTEGAIKVIMLSQEEARRMGHNFVGTEQLLLGVIGQRHGIGARALKKLKVTLKKREKKLNYILVAVLVLLLRKFHLLHGLNVY
jgi:ATP-dependent Clp protease ATP-binding subunit ClpC